MKEAKAREFVDSKDVGQYQKLPKRLKEKFTAFDKLNSVKPQASSLRPAVSRRLGRPRRQSSRAVWRKVEWPDDPISRASGAFV
jgi:hypothetical protein